MRVLFFLLDGETNASSRHRVLQYFTLLRQHGIEPFASRPVPEPVYQRLVEQRRHATDKGVFYATFAACRALDVLRAHRFDVVVIQRDLFPFGPPFLERLLFRRNPRLVYDTDDATYLRPVFTPKTPFQRLRRFDKVEEVARAARWVSAATEPIARWARRFNAHVSVVPMAVNLAEYDRARRASPAHGPLVIGWAGTPGGLTYLYSLAPVLRETAREREFVVRVISGGYRDVSLPGVRVQALPWRASAALADMAEFDVGLVPLDDTPFEQAKFPFKLLQYMALGIPSVTARVGAARSIIQHGHNGLLAGTPDEWREALKRLIRDAELRKTLGDAARATVASNYTLERVGPVLIRGLTDAAT